MLLNILIFKKKLFTNKNSATVVKETRSTLELGKCCPTGILVTFILLFYRERRPARTDLIVLVAHNDDPTGNNIHFN